MLKNKILAGLSILMIASVSHGGDFSKQGKNTGGTPLSPVAPIVAESHINYIPYFSIGYGTIFLKDDISAESFDSKVLSVNVGVDIGNHFGVEAKYRTSTGDMEYDNGDTGNIASLDFPATLESYGLFANLHTTFYDSFRPYLFVGGGNTVLDAVPLSSLGRAARSEFSLQYGAGALYTFMENTSVFVDYTVLYDDEGFDGRARTSTITSDSLSFGVRYDFQ